MDVDTRGALAALSGYRIHVVRSRLASFAPDPNRGRAASHSDAAESPCTSSWACNAAQSRGHRTRRSTQRRNGVRCTAGSACHHHRRAAACPHPLFASAAQSFRSGVIGVVLTGSNSDASQARVSKCRMRRSHWEMARAMSVNAAAFFDWWHRLILTTPKEERVIPRARKIQAVYRSHNAIWCERRVPAPVRCARVSQRRFRGTAAEVRDGRGCQPR
jgi:hypothetical protein